MFDVRRKQHSREVVFVGLKGGDGDNSCDIGVLDHAPDVNVALYTRTLF